MNWETVDGVSFIRQEIKGNRLAGFGFEGTLVDANLKLDEKFIELFKLLHEKQFNIIIISNQGMYDDKKITPIGMYRPCVLNEPAFRKKVEIILKRLPPVSFYYTTDIKKHKPNPEIWRMIFSGLADRSSFYSGGHAGRPKDLTADDITMARALGIQFRLPDWFDDWRNLQSIKQMAVIPIVANVPEQPKPIVNPAGFVHIENIFGKKTPGPIVQTKAPEEKPIEVLDEPIIPIEIQYIKTELICEMNEEIVQTKAPEEKPIEIQYIKTELMKQIICEMNEEIVQTKVPEEKPIELNEEIVQTKVPEEKSIEQKIEEEPIQNPNEICIINDCKYIANENEVAILVAPPGIFRRTLMEILITKYILIDKFGDAKKIGRYIMQEMPKKIPKTAEKFNLRYLVFEIDKELVLNNASPDEIESVNAYFKNFKVPEGVINSWKL